MVSLNRFFLLSDILRKSVITTLTGKLWDTCKKCDNNCIIISLCNVMDKSNNSLGEHIQE